ncbi:MAG TPA: DUF3301 domain-containing protein [Steroidobacter sp.]|uniref:DUF3301 domain-containing protein n=1 Tax=Steroidobacter sp. TaxID=1978227 RepID=UPI002ED8BB07
MELGWGALVLLVVAAAIVWFLQDSLAARERANIAAMEACQRLSLQFLDGTVAFARLAFAREHGRLTFRRTYVFDYTANSIERRQGFVILLGRRIESVGYAPGEERRQSQQPPVTISASATFTSQAAPPAQPRQIESAKVFDLADWRARRRATEQQSSASPQTPGESSGTAPRTPPRTSIGASEHGNGHADGQDHHQ